MIVADANLLTFLVIRGDNTTVARAIFAGDPFWIAPPLWRSEMRSVLLKHLRAGLIDFASALGAWARAEATMRDAPLPVNTELTLDLSLSRGISSYDAEYIAMATELGVPLITNDRKLIRACPRETVAMDAFLPGSRRD